MDRRLQTLLNRQQANGFTGLAGSQARAAIRVSAALVNDAIAVFASSSTSIEKIVVTPRAGNRFDVQLKLAKPAFLPPINVTVAIERQPRLPDDPTLVLLLTGASGLMRFAGPAMSTFGGGLPPGVRLDGDRVFIDIRAALAAQRQSEWLEYVEELEVSTDEAAVVLYLQARVR